MHPFSAWWLAIRPKTLSLSISPVVVGNCMAWSDLGRLDGSVAMLTLGAALLIQIGTNLYNDAADHERGADTPARLGPPRATAQGWLSARQVKFGAALSFGLAGLAGAWLAWVGGWPILLLGSASLAAGYAYTGGPRPIAYSALGELFVLLFFGVLAVGGSYFLQAGSVSAAALAAGTAIGLLAAAVLLVNNYRDLDTDRLAHKLTLCHRLERRGARRLYGALLLLPCLLAPWDPVHAWPVLLILPFSLRLLRRFLAASGGPELNAVLAGTARLQLGYGALLSAGYLV